MRVAPRASSTGLHSTADGDLVTVTDQATYLIDPETLSVVDRHSVGSGGFGMAITSDGGRLALATQDGRLRILDLASGRVRTFVGSGDAELTIGAFSPNGHTLSTSHGENVILWDSQSGVVKEILEGHSAPVGPHVFSPEGPTLYTGAEDSAAIVWDVAGDRRLGRPFRPNSAFLQEESNPPAFDISPDGRTLAAGEFVDGGVELIDARTLRRADRFEAFAGGPILAIEFSPDGRRLAVGGQNGGVGLWDARATRRIGPLLLAPRGPTTDNPHSVQALAYGPGELLAAAGVGGGVRIGTSTNES